MAAPATQVPPAGPGANILLSGTVYDSTMGMPLRTALVQLVHEHTPARVRSVVTDSNGRFHFDSLGAGRYLLGFHHPRLDSLLLDSPVVHAIELSDEAEALEVLLALPSVGSLTRRHCGSSQNEQRDALILGRVRSTGADLPAQLKAGVRARWSLITASGTSLRSSRDSSDALWRDSFSYALCGIPSDGSITVQAWVGTDSSGVVALEVPASGMLLRDLYVATPRNELADDTAGTGKPSRAVHGKLTGVVRDSTGAGIADARVAGPSPAGEVRTDSTGQFVLRGFPGGTQSLVVRAIGYQPMQAAIDVMDQLKDEQGGPLSFVMKRTPATLSTVTVSAGRSYAGFEARRHRGAGIYLDELTIKRRQPQVVADLMKFQPGVRVLSPADDEPQFITRFGRRGCEPSVYVDGRLLPRRTKDLDAYVAVSNIRAVEIYSVPAEVPLEFSFDIFCGAVIIWTKQ
jgi:hypothetical protein